MSAVQSMSASSTLAPPPYTDSTSSQTKIDEKTYPSEKAISSSASSAYEYSVHKVLNVNAFGKSWGDYSTHGQETEISITTTSDREEYRNIRPNPSRGSCILHHRSSVDGSLIPVSETTYRWGPGRSPIVKLFYGEKQEQAEEVVIHSKNVLSRTAVFESERLGKFSWRYASRGAFDCLSKKAENVIIMERFEGANGKKMVEIARLVRGLETRTAGTKWNEGNGGRLEMKAELGDDLEVLILSTCMVMLKRELDALLGSQIAVIS